MTLTLSVAVVALAAMLLGEVWRVTAAGPARDAPLATATAVALAMSTSWPELDDEPGRVIGILGPLLLACGACLAVGAARHAWSVLPGDLARVATSVLVAGALVRVPLPNGRYLLEYAEAAGRPASLVAMALLAVAVLAVAAPILLRCLVHAPRDHVPLRVLVPLELGRHGPLALAAATTAAVMALAVKVLGPASFALFLLPLLVLQPAVSRQRQIRVAQQQTLYALARLTEQAGLTAPGHAARVAALAVPVAREAGVPETDLEDVEAVALLHDIGQVGLSRPIPGGATVEVSGRDQRRIAATGASILARTAQLSRLAALVADVGIAHHRALARGDVHPAARVVRVASAYDDLTGRGTRLSGAQSPVAALERISRNAPHEYDPLVVQALVRHLARRGVLGAHDLDQIRTR